MLSAFASPYAAASDGNPSDNTITSSDLEFAFDQSAGPVHVMALSDQEMEETEGALAPWLIAIGVRAGWGALGGAFGYSGQWAGSQLGDNRQDFSGQGLAMGIAGGAVGGMVGWNNAAASTIGAGTGGFIGAISW